MDLKISAIIIYRISKIQSEFAEYRVINYTHLQIPIFCRLQLSSHIKFERNLSLITECYLLFSDLLEFPGKMTPNDLQLP
jgi:hypothetical protein